MGTGVAPSLWSPESFYGVTDRRYGRPARGQIIRQMERLVEGLSEALSVAERLLRTENNLNPERGRRNQYVVKKVKPIGSLVRVSSTHCCASTSRLSTS